MAKVLTIVGARPQFIKAAMVNKKMAAAGVEEVIAHTGQHYDDNMSDVFFRELGIDKPKYFLNINGDHHGTMTGRMMIEIEKVIRTEKPDMVLVYGDTNSTLAGALVAQKLQVKVCHVEGGLRSYDMSIPEEVNRVLTDRISDIVICPTQRAIDNLEKEGFKNFPIKIFLTGDLMADAYFQSVKENIKSSLPAIPSDFVLCTIHRASNTRPEVLNGVIEGLNAIAEKNPVVFPVHPRTKAILKEYQIPVSPRVHLLDPIGYLETMSLLRACQFVVTDSGGLQREAYLAKKPGILVMPYTPWQELVDGEYSLLCSPNKESMTEAVRLISKMKPDWSTHFYGTGRGAEEIVQIIAKELGGH